MSYTYSAGWQNGMDTTITKPAGGGFGAGAAASMSAISALASIGSAYAQSQAMRAQASFNDKMAAINARFSQLRGDDAIARAEKDVKRRRLEAKKTIGAQRASFGAQGIALDSGTALEAQEETAAFSASDVLTLRNNAWREAWGYKVEAMTGQAHASIESSGTRFAAGQTLLTGGITAARDIAGSAREYRRTR